MSGIINSAGSRSGIVDIEGSNRPKFIATGGVTFYNGAYTKEYTDVWYNSDGQYLNSDGKFTCTIPGIYQFGMCTYTTDENHDEGDWSGFRITGSNVSGNFDVAGFSQATGSDASETATFIWPMESAMVCRVLTTHTLDNSATRHLFYGIYIGAN